jgi:hypothetical protein
MAFGLSIFSLVEIFFFFRLCEIVGTVLPLFSGICLYGFRFLCLCFGRDIFLFSGCVRF